MEKRYSDSVPPLENYVNPISEDYKEHAVMLYKRAVDAARVADGLEPIYGKDQTDHIKSLNN